MKCVMLGLLAETNLHFGAGTQEGAIDLPVARESATGHPVLVGSSLKGSLRDAAEQRWNGRAGGARENDIVRIFGVPDGAGGVIVGDARLLLLPVRSLSSAYKWITCPLVLERLRRDADRCGFDNFNVPAVEVAPGNCLGEGENELFLEEREFSFQERLPNGLIDAIGKLIGHDDVRKRLATQLIVLHDDDFDWFARYGLQVIARNALTEKKTSSNVWYEETLPPDTLLYAVLADRELGGGKLGEAMKLFTGSEDARPYLQAGGNETVGQGWMHVKEVQ